MKRQLIIAMVLLGAGVSNAQTTNEEAQARSQLTRKKMRESLTNAVVKAAASVQERKAWIESNRIRFGENWQIAVYGDSRTNPPPAEKLPDFIFQLNTNFFAHHPEEGGLTVEGMIGGARKRIAARGKTQAASNSWISAFDSAVTKGLKGMVTNEDGVHFDAVYSANPNVLVVSNKIVKSPM